MSVPGPVLGPCESWIDGQYLIDSGCCPGFTGSDVTADLLDTVAFEASMMLYELSGRRFTGLCERTVRPCRNAADCWSTGPIQTGYGYGGWYWTWNPNGPIIGWAWMDENGPLCGCRPLSQVRLAGYPVREITEVKIDGVVLDANDSNGNPNYRLDHWRDLTRMDDPVTGQKRRWPSCQNLALDDTEAGTFSVSYRWGIDPPELGRLAASELACQLLLSCPGTGGEGECELPDGVTRLERQGITIDRQILAGFFDPRKPTGLTGVDMFMAGYARIPGSRAPMVYSPDVQQYAPKLG